MDDKETGGPAFPRDHRSDGHNGMSLRDYFAAKAMQSITSVLHKGIRPADLDAMARDAYGIADAMLKARNS
ncbi:MAG: hypothetical protein RJA36_1384 [Pseudomonadota bacterium]|jgi:hypothetical protein